jgi:hypothetical protein
LVFDACKFGLGVGELSGSNVDGDGQEVSLLVVGFDSLVFSESFEVEGVFDLGKELVAKDDDSSDGGLVGELFGSGGNGGEGLEERSPRLSVGELGCSFDGKLEVLLEELDTLSGELCLGVDLSGSLDECLLSGGCLEVISEESSAFGDDGGGLFVFSHLLLELGVLFLSIGIEFITLFVVSVQFSLL